MWHEKGCVLFSVAARKEKNGEGKQAILSTQPDKTNCPLLLKQNAVAFELFLTVYPTSHVTPEQFVAVVHPLQFPVLPIDPLALYTYPSGMGIGSRQMSDTKDENNKIAHYCSHTETKNRHLAHA